LVVEIVSKEQDIAGIYLPKTGYQVHIWVLGSLINQKVGVNYILLGRMLMKLLRISGFLFKFTSSIKGFCHA
jgi:hypothetical protein